MEDTTLTSLAERLRSCTDRERRDFLAAMEQRETYLHVLNNFSVSLIEISSFDDLVWFVAKEVVAQLGFDDCVIYEYLPERELLVQRAAIGDKNPSGRTIINPLEIPLGSGVTGTVARNRKPMVVDDLSLYPGYVKDLSPALSEVCVPLLHGSNLLGVIDSEDPRKGFFSQQHVEILTSVASMTSSKIMECRAMQELENKAQILNRVREAVVVADVNGVITDCNNGAAALYGYSRQELLGTNVGDLVADKKAWEADLPDRSRALIKRGLWRGHERIKRGRGGEIIADVSLTPILDERGNHVQTIAVGRDITDLLEAEEALREQNRILESKQVELERALSAGEAARSANRAKDAFLANTSHELRTPLTGVIGMIDLLRETNLTAEQEEYALTAQNSAQALTSIIDDILDLAKMEAGKVSLNEAPFDPRALVLSAAQSLRPAAQGKGLAYDIAVPEKGVTVLGDANRVRQILFNLVGNAIKFTERGFVKVNLHLQEMDTDKCRVRVCVEDSGQGFSKEAHARIFGRFEQVDISSSKSTGGAGLGLSISRELAKLMNGTIWADSEAGVGSQFYCDLFLPITQDVPEADVSEPSAAPQRLHDLSILVAEDNFINQMLVRRLLEIQGWSPKLADNGKEAVDAILAGEHFDIILMDIRMPVMDGIEAVQLIRQSDAPSANVPIIALTANAMESDRARYKAAGMNALVPKPIDRELLMQTIQRLVEAQKS